MTETPPDTVTGLLSDACRRARNAPAIYYADEVWSFSRLDDASRRAASALAALGVGPGDRVAFWLPNSPAYLVLYFACARLGAVSVAVNTRYRAGEVEDVLSRTRAKVLAMWPNFRGIDFPSILAEVDPHALEHLETVVLYTESGEDQGPLPAKCKTVSFGSLLSGAALDTDRAEASMGVNTFTTSGTTRAPKFVLHSNLSIARHAADVAKDFGHHRARTVVLQELPLGGVFGFAGFMATVAAACPTVLTSAFDAQRSLRLLERHRITHFDASDEMVDRLLSANPDDAAFARINFVGFASFNSYLENITERAEQRGLTLCGLWGMSEMQALVARRSECDPASERKRGGGRLVSPRAQVRVRDPHSGELCAPGVAGEIEICGPSQMLGYLDDAEATADAFTDDGFVRTGDLGTIESTDVFHYLTRMGDVLRLGGFLVSPAEIEAQIQAHPSVGGVQVVSAPLDGADRAVAFVVPSEGSSFDAAAIRSHCQSRLAGYKVPARVVALDAFPVTESANGVKIQRAKLREMARAVCAED